MTKEQVFEKFKEFQETLKEYENDPEKNEDGSSKLGVFAVLGRTDEKQTGIYFDSAICGTVGTISKAIDGALYDENVRVMLHSVLADRMLLDLMEEPAKP